MEDSHDHSVYPKPTIIIADDDFFMRGQMKLAVDDFLDVIEAESGDQAIELYKKHNPSLIILDIHMPKQSGKEVLKEILDYHPNAYIIMVSADSVASNIEETVFAGAKGFIVKPFTKDSILKHVLACTDLQKNPEKKINQA